MENPSKILKEDLELVRRALDGQEAPESEPEIKEAIERIREEYSSDPESFNDSDAAILEEAIGKYNLY